MKRFCIACLVCFSCGGTTARPTAPMTTTQSANKMQVAGTQVATPLVATSKDQQSPAEVLTQYLRFALGRYHENAYTLLSDKDQKARARVTYVNDEREADRLRDQVSALGETTFKISWLKANADQATAIVHFTTGLGVSKMRFLLRLEPSGWRIDYINSWQQLEAAAAAKPVDDQSK